MDRHDPGPDASDASGLFSFLYVSEMSRPDPHELSRICEQSRANNLRDRITGLLVFDGQAFCQFVEGGERVIAALLTRLELDPRHRDMRLLQFGPLAGSRRFPLWRLGYAYSGRSVGDRPDADDARCGGRRCIRALGPELTHRGNGEP